MASPLKSVRNHDISQQLEDAVSHAMATSGSSGAIVGVWAPWSGALVSGFGTE